MWKKYSELNKGFYVCISLILIGILLQISVGRVHWELLSYPVNIYFLFGYLFLLLLLYVFRKRIRFMRWAMTYRAAIPALIFLLALTLLMGMIKQVPGNESHPIHWLGMTDMLSFWPFVLVYGWNTTILGWVSVRSLCSFRWNKLPFLLNHLGLFTAFLCSTLGNADVKRLKMTVCTELKEWRAIDEDGEICEVPLLIELKKFTIDEYPPKIALIDHATGQHLPEEKPRYLMLDEGVDKVSFRGWDIAIAERMEYAVPVFDKDSVKYIKREDKGACYAAYVEAISSDKKIMKSGWISCGSGLFSLRTLRLDSVCSLFMLEREPKRFVSELEIRTGTGKKITTDISVNHPVEIEGWKIYQVGYDTSAGRWSDISMLELVSDPWLPYVYAGIGMMMAGSVLMFMTMRKRKEESE